MSLTDIHRAFVTGGAGFIGSHIVDRLAQTATNITIYDNFSTGQEQFISHHARNPKIRIVRADVLAALDRDVVVAGVLSRIEIWDAQRWATRDQEGEQVISAAVGIPDFGI